MDNAKVSSMIFNKLMAKLPKIWDGKQAILFMKGNNCRNWKQLEWPGWYFQFMCERILGKDSFFKIPGPAYGNVEFDGKYEIPWDFKAHTNNASSATKVPTNGYAEIEQALKEYPCVGFIIAEGEAVFDDETGSFKQWHDSLKGKMTAYEKDRIKRGAISRRRKVSFQLKKITFVFLNTQALSYCGSFQKGMRNADGSPRNPKVMLDLSDEHLEKYTYDVK